MPTPAVNISFALYSIEQFFPDAYEPEYLITMDDEILHKLAKPVTGAKLRLLLRAYKGLKESLRESAK